MIRTIVVDDEPAARERYVSYVAGHEAGFCVVAGCASAREAYAAAGREQPRLILTDIRMPGEDGLSLLSRLRASGWKGIAVIISGHDDFTYAQQAIRLGVYDFLLKPVFPEDMRSLLSRVATKLAAEGPDPGDAPGDCLSRAESGGGCREEAGLPEARIGAGGDRMQPGRSRIEERSGPGDVDRAAAAGSALPVEVLPRVLASGGIPGAVKKALAFVESNLETRFSLDDAARAACVSPSWLGSSFRRIFGCSFMEYARRYRIHTAVRLLVSTDAPLKDIADRLGFPDLPTFSKLFRKIAGTSPGAYRRTRTGGTGRLP